MLSCWFSQKMQQEFQIENIFIFLHGYRHHHDRLLDAFTQSQLDKHLEQNCRKLSSVRKRKVAEKKAMKTSGKLAKNESAILRGKRCWNDEENVCVNRWEYRHMNIKRCFFVWCIRWGDYESNKKKFRPRAFDDKQLEDKLWFSETKWQDCKHQWFLYWTRGALLIWISLRWGFNGSWTKFFEDLNFLLLTRTMKRIYKYP